MLPTGLCKDLPATALVGTFPIFKCESIVFYILPLFPEEKLVWMNMSYYNSKKEHFPDFASPVREISSPSLP
jgi:hypothetical protein